VEGDDEAFYIVFKQQCGVDEELLILLLSDRH